MQAAPREHPPARRRPRAWLRAVAWMGLGAGMTVAALSLVAALALPALESRPELAAEWIADYLGREVRLESFEMAWQGGEPLLRLRGLEVGAGGDERLALRAAEVRVDTLRSIRARALRPASVTVRGADIRVDRAPDGSFTVAGLGTNRPAASRSGLGDGIGRVVGSALAVLPAPAHITLEDAAVTVGGLGGRDESVVLRPVSLNLQHWGDGLRLSGSVATDRAPRAPARFSLRWPRGASDPLAAAELTLALRDLPLDTLPAGIWNGMLGGRLSAELEGSIANGAIDRLRGNLTVARPDVAFAPGALGHLEGVRSLVEFARGDGDWTLHLLRLEPRSTGRTWPASAASVSRRTAPGGQPRYQLTLDSAPVAGLLPAMQRLRVRPQAARRLVAAVVPQGRVEGLRLSLDPARPTARLEAATLRDVWLRDPAGRFAMGPISASLELDNSTGRLNLMPTPLVLEAADDTQALRLAAGGDLRWRQADGQLWLQSTGLNLADGDSRLRLNGSVRLPLRSGQPVTLDLQARSGAMQVDTLKRYLALVPELPKLKAWLRASLDGGLMHDVTARLSGTVSGPSDLRDALRVTAAFRDATVHYNREWPSLERLRGTLSMKGLAFGFTLEDGRVSGARIVSATGSIEDVTARRPSLVVRGRATGALANGSAFLGASPLAPRFKGLFRQLRASGKAWLDLRMKIPLHRARASVTGTVGLRDNELRVAALRSALGAVSGTIGFNADGLGTGTLEATYLDRRIEARVDGTPSGHQRTRLAIRGTSDGRTLVRVLHDVGVLESDRMEAYPLLARLAGEAAGEVTLEIPHEEDIDSRGIALAVTTDLHGMALELPAPLGKLREERRRLEVTTRLALPGDRTFRMRYGERTQAVLRVTVADDGAVRLERGELRFGGRPAVLPETAGIRVAGSVDALSVDEWVAFVAQAADGQGNGGSGPTTALALMRSVQVDARRLEVLGAGFDGVRMRMAPEGKDAWRIAVRGEALDGTIHLPTPVGRAPIDAEFEHLHVRRDSGAKAPAANSTLAPADLPPARLVARRLRYNDVELGLAKLTLIRGRNALVLDELLTIHDDYEVRGKGSWTAGAVGSESQVDLRIHSNNFGKLTSALGYGDSGVDGGVAEIALRAGWKGSPFDLSLQHVDGVLHFRASAGHLREVERGASGRVFGLLNVTILPRRLLRLDFSDLFEEGVSYERLEGSFRLLDGHAYTENVRMETENARVDLVGRVGLVAEDYDQTMTVTPKLSSSLPLAPLWLAEKFLNRKLIDSAFAYRYYITGTWSDPVIERETVEAEPSEAG